MLKSTLIAVTITCSMALPAIAGGLSEPVMETDIIIAETTTASSGSAAMPLIVFALLIALAKAN